jgi:hypothetical protein
MADKKELKKAALQWIHDWNHRNINNIMDHYADDVMFYSPTVIRRWNKPEGKLEGKVSLEQHFKKGLEEMPDIHFEFHSILYGLNSIILFYKRETGILAADVVTFNKAGKVSEVRTYYEEGY